MSDPYASARPLLAIEDLRVTFATRHGPVEALRGVSIAIERGETVGIVGESGSGKSVTALTAMGLLDSAGRVTGGRIHFRGQDLLTATPQEMQVLRGGGLSMVFQNPRAALNPIRAVGDQISDVLRAHQALSKADARTRALHLLEAVRIRDAQARLAAYPHELSGGTCQRVMIAMAIASAPDLIIADEPTTGLDVTTQKVAMDLLADLCARRGTGLLFITHDLALASTYCQRIVVMQAGEVVETATPSALFTQPAHSYTRRLVAASPTPTSTVGDLVEAQRPATRAPARNAAGKAKPVLLDVSGLTKRFDSDVMAVDDVSFTIREGESVGLVGESGSGKSTTARLVMRLIDTTDGHVVFDGVDIGRFPARTFHKAPQRKDIQIVFQDAGESINPRFSAFDAIADPLRQLTGVGRGAVLTGTVEDAATRCGFPLELLDRFPHQLSGGQRARVGIARAIVSQPRLVVLDEPTAALDVSVQATVLYLLDTLRRETGMAFLFVSHDLNVVRMMCERTIVMKAGKIVETGRSDDLFQAPKASYTRELMAAIPTISFKKSSVSEPRVAEPFHASAI